MNNNNNFLVKLLIICFLNILFIEVNAQRDSTGNDLAEMSLEDLLNIKITTASKTSQKAGQAPATVIVISEEQIRIRNYRSLLEVLNDLPDFKIDDKVYSTVRNIVTVRGMQGQEKFIIMLDGVRISSPTNEANPIMENYPVNLAKQIEIIYGPASALYGADALSGIINIISRKAERNTGIIDAKMAVGDYGLYNGSLFTSRKLGKEVVLTLSGQYFYDNGPNMSTLYKDDTLWNMQSHSTGTFNSIFGPLTPITPVNSNYSAPLAAYNIYAGLKVNDFTFSFFKNHSQNSTALENNPSNAVYNDDVFYKRGTSVVNAAYTKKLGNITSTSSLTGSMYQIDPESNYRNLYTNMEPAYKYGYGSMIKAEQQLGWDIGKKINLTGGGIYEHFNSAPEGADLQSPVKKGNLEGTLLNTASYYKPEGIEAKFYVLKYYNTGTYLQLQYTPSKSIAFTIGSRYDYSSRYGATFNPRLGLVWNPTKTTTIKAMAATAFLAPTTTSSYGYYGSFYTADSGQTYQSYFFHLPNPGLKPITSKNAELSMRQYIGKYFSLTLTGYYTQLNNLLYAAPDDGNTNLYGGKSLGWNVDYIEVFINKGRQDITGGSLQLDHTLRSGNTKINSYMALSYVDGTEEYLDPTNNFIPKNVQITELTSWMLKTGTDISVGKFSISPRLSLIGKQRINGFIDNNNPFERQTLHGYALLNISAAYHIGKLTVFIKVINALNQKYRNVGPNMDLNNPNTELFYGNYQDPLRVNGGLRVAF